LEHQEEVIAIGECGIDLHFPDNARLEVQQKLLQLQAELARKLQLPIVIHSRDGFEETIEVLKEFSDLKMYFHSRGYGKVALEKAESLFPSLWIGFNNIISYPNAHQTRESLLAAKKAHILIETDAPYLPPQVFRGQRNYPEYVSYVYEKCAELLEMKQVELEEMIRENFERFVQ
jgi:TatD DNase family protein